MKSIPDHLKEDMDILFVGFNPSILSGETGHHYANPTNRFWNILHLSCLTERKYNPGEDGKLLELGYGLTNIVSRPTKNAEEITKEEYLEGSRELLQKIETYRPKIICYVGKGIYQQFTKKKDIPWGVQEQHVVPGTIDFVAPSSSGLVRMKLDDIVTIYRQLADMLGKL
ncbi:MAG TPA: G/U mismatch-specific DNA glycosylase [Bacillaceae bacterium]